MTQHYLFGGSNIHRRLECLGSAVEEPKHPSISSAAADRGTRMHEAIEALFLGRIGRTSKAYEDLPEEDAEIVGGTLSDVMDFLHMNDVDLCKATIETEKTFTWGESAHVGGTVDLVVHDDDHLIILDYKFGRVRVEPLCEQLMFYAAVAILTAPEGEAPEHVTVAVAQPEHTSVGGCVRYETHNSLMFVDWFKRKVAEAVKSYEAGEIYYKLGRHCGYCNGKATCPLQIGTSIALEAEDDPSVKLDWAENALPLIEAIRNEALVKLEEDENCIPGWERQPKRAVARWQGGAENQLIQVIGEEARGSKLLSPSQLKKKFPEHTKMIDDLTIKESSGYNVKRKKD